MNRAIVITLCALLLAACSRESRKIAAIGGGAPMPVQALAVPPGAAGSARRSNDTLAYEHTVTVELSKEQLPVRMQEVQSACTSNKDFACTVLDMHLQRSETIPSGS